MSGHFRVPSPAMAVALIALLLAAGGLAVAAIPDSKGVIHACYAKDSGALRVVKGKKCAGGEKSLSWNQGIGQVTVRTAKLVQHYTKCTPFPMTSTYNCSGPATTVTVHCKPGERATGGGYGKNSDGAPQSFTENRPSPASGTPTGWTASTGGAYAISSGPSHPDTVTPVYAVCAKG